MERTIVVFVSCLFASNALLFSCASIANDSFTLENPDEVNLECNKFEPMEISSKYSDDYLVECYIHYKKFCDLHNNTQYGLPYARPVKEAKAFVCRSPGCNYDCSRQSDLTKHVNYYHRTKQKQSTARWQSQIDQENRK